MNPYESPLECEENDPFDVVPIIIDTAIVVIAVMLMAGGIVIGWRLHAWLG